MAFRETITAEALGEGKYIRQSGGRGHYGHAKIRLAPADPGEGFVFVDKIRGGDIPLQFIAPVEAGIREALENGILAGYPVVDVRVELIDGSYHEIDSNELAFRIAGSMAFRDAATKAGPTLLEPMMEVEVIVPEKYMGDIIGDLNSRRSKILGLGNRAEARTVVAVVPLSEMFGYATRLRSLSQGRAVYSMEFSHYSPVPESSGSRNAGWVGSALSATPGVGAAVVRIGKKK